MELDLPNVHKRFSTFSEWRKAWDASGRFSGRLLPEPERRIAEIVDLWRADIPNPWVRSEAETPTRLLGTNRYTRGNLNTARKGEHEIEYQILEECFVRCRYRSRKLLDGVNAFPIVKDSAGSRRGDIEPDLVLLVEPADAALIVVADVKKTDGNPWSALVQNLRQLRLFLANPVCSSFFQKRGLNASVVQTYGAVVAPEAFYSSRGQKLNSLTHARKLSEAMLRAHNVRSELLVWDADLAQFEPYA